MLNILNEYFPGSAFFVRLDWRKIHRLSIHMSHHYRQKSNIRHHIYPNPPASAPPLFIFSLETILADLPRQQYRVAAARPKIDSAGGIQKMLADLSADLMLEIVTREIGSVPALSQVCAKISATMSTVKRLLCASRLTEKVNEVGVIHTDTHMSKSLLTLPDGPWLATIPTIRDKCLHGILVVESDHVYHQNVRVNFSYGVLCGKWTRNSSMPTSRTCSAGYFRHKIDHRLCFTRVYGDAGKLNSLTVSCMLAEKTHGDLPNCVMKLGLREKWMTDEEAADHFLSVTDQSGFRPVGPVEIFHEFIRPPGDIIDWLRRRSYRFVC